jgi:hypothetical protein
VPCDGIMLSQARPQMVLCRTQNAKSPTFLCPGESPEGLFSVGAKLWGWNRSFDRVCRARKQNTGRMRAVGETRKAGRRRSKAMQRRPKLSGKEDYGRTALWRAASAAPKG